MLNYRMLKAAELLKLTRLSISDISNAVGYANPLHFSRALAEDAIQIPVSALANENQETIVYTVENGICRKMAVTTGVYSGGFVEILSGLSDGQQIIDHPGDYELKDGAKIEVLP